MHWYEDDVAAAIDKREKCIYTPETIFYGSSSFTLWDDLYEVFKDFKPVNLGFGGSTLAACIQFFERIVAPLPTPQRFILYAGDNDLGDGSDPHEVYALYRKFTEILRERYGDIPFYYVSIKPSLNRFEIIEKIRHTNQLIKDSIKKSEGNDHYINIYNRMLDAKGAPMPEFFEDDGLHLNEAGYDVWKEAILEQFQSAEQLVH